MLTTKQCIFLLSFVSTCSLFPALITKSDTSLSTEVLAEFHLFSELPKELQTSVPLLAIDTVEQPSTKKWLAQSRTTNKQFNEIFSNVIEQAPVIFERLQPKIDAALRAADFDTSTMIFSTRKNNNMLSKIIAENIITTNFFYTQQIAQGKLLPSFCAADAQQNPLFFYPNFGCHLISCCAVDGNAQQKETSAANKEKNLKLLLAHTTSHDPHGQEAEHFIQKMAKSENRYLLEFFHSYVSIYYDNNFDDYINWQQKVLNKNSLIATKEESQLEQQNTRNLVELTESLQGQIIQELQNNSQIVTSMAQLALSSADKNTALNGFVLLIHQNFGHLIAPHINNNQLDPFIHFFCDGIYQGILQQNGR